MSISDGFYGQWEDRKNCGCGTGNFVVIRAAWINVPMMDQTAKAWANTGRWFVGILTLGISEAVTGGNGDITHEAIECKYRCKKCGHYGHYTFDFNVTGKRNRCGIYNKQHAEIESWDLSLKQERTIEDITQLFRFTWPNDNASTYNMVYLLVSFVFSNDDYTLRLQVPKTVCFCMVYNNCKKFAGYMWRNMWMNLWNNPMFPKHMEN
ncbi:uncharacterized protein LOC129601765 isoform X2 [Paramacrobiotus metropolitanus]|uniref:uncharacterized protein LOC129601765 isoform X2 n=1 Tax=Paramacrobiotus metropolitanus TaxID=2943436 RepID=UPI002445AADE|nr:uncharacterized protein LOC129601765 isoform X2 [Paramacrobiotus metropolitanus]